MANEAPSATGTRTNGVASKIGDAGSAGRRLDALLDILPIGVFTIGPDMRVRLMNGEAARLANTDPRTAVGKSCEEVLQCMVCDGSCAAQETQRCGESRRGCPVDLRRDDGSYLSVVIDSAPLGDGEVAVTMRDVTETERLKRTLKERWAFHGLVGASSPMRDVVGQIRDVAPYDSTVLIVGENGTGKELVARAIHAESPRAGRPFVTIDCSAYSENLLESELFGHVRGAFAGADRDRVGRLASSEGGTVFLDEVCTLSPKVQARLLHVLEAREVERVGEGRSRPVDVRVIAATRRDLPREVHAGRFREDLFTRLNTFTLRLPPLRERKEDLPALVDHMLQRAALRTGKEAPGLAEDAMEAFLAHGWPGNVRELESTIDSAVANCKEGAIHAADLPAGLTGRTEPEGPGHAEKMRAALHRAAGSVTLAARLLGVHRTTLWRWMSEARLEREDFMPR